MPPKKKFAEKGILVHTGGRGLKKSPFLVHKKGTYSYWGSGLYLFVICPMFTFVFLFPNNLEYFLRPYSMKIVNLSLLLEGRGGK